METIRLILVTILFSAPLAARADVAQSRVENGLASGTSMEYRPIGIEPQLGAILVARFDRRPGAEVETAWMLYDRSLSVLGYATLFEGGALSNQNVQWSEQPGALRDFFVGLIRAARTELIGKEDKEQPAALAEALKQHKGLVLFKPRTCAVKVAGRPGVVELDLQDAQTKTVLPVHLFEVAASPEKRECGDHVVSGALKCFAAGDDTVVVVPFRQKCEGNVEQQLLATYSPATFAPARENVLGERSLKKRDLKGARKHFEAALKMDEKYAPANFNFARTLALSGVKFEEAKGPLEQIVADREQRKTWIRQIKDAPELESWRKGSDFPKWLAQYE